MYRQFNKLDYPSTYPQPNYFCPLTLLRVSPAHSGQCGHSTQTQDESCAYDETPLIS